MSQQTTIRKLAELVNTPVEKLLEQLAEAGMTFSGPDQIVTSAEKLKLLGFLKRAHGKSESAAEETVEPKKITLSRNRKQELTVGGGKNKTTVDVVVRKKVTLVKQPERGAAAGDDDERSEILRKLEESRQRNLDEQQRLADEDRKRAEEAAERKRLADEAAAQAAAEAAQAAAALGDGEEGAAARPKPAGTHGHGHPKPARPDAPRADDRSAHKHKPNRGSHVMVADVEDDDATARFAGQLHLSTAERERRSTSRGSKSRPARRQIEQSRSGGGQHGFTRPTEKVVREVSIGEAITVSDLAQKLALKGGDVVKALFKMGVMATITQTIDHDTASLVTEELGHKAVRAESDDAETELLAHIEGQQGDKAPRPPVVTIMGHVDHGKTSLLDYIRRTKVAAGEAGGITQHIGAYHVETPKGVVSFLDTPGHAAFTAMRARGAKLTDIVILVVAADDGVMPQTIEAIRHAKAAGVPMVVAINKIDRPDANPDRVKQELLSHDVVLEDFGGDVLGIPVSAIKHTNLDKLIEAVQLQAELLDLRANPEREAHGTIIEAKLDRGRGVVATVLVQRGTLRVGDIVVAGAQWGRVRALLDDRGQAVEAAGPSMPVEILGLDGVPEPGDLLAAVENEKRAREITEYRQRKRRDQAHVVATGARGSLEDMFSQLRIGDSGELPLVLKSDVHGSLEAITAGLEKISTDEVKVRILLGGVGAITESDVTLAAASKAAILGFNVRANAQAREMARRDGVEIRYYSIIYELLDEVKGLLSGMLKPESRETILGHAEIREIFSVPKVGKIAGCMVVDGMFKRSVKVRLLRDNVVIYDGVLGSLRRFKDDVREVKEGFECGMSIENYGDIRQGDVIEAYEIEEVARSL